MDNFEINLSSEKSSFEKGSNSAQLNASSENLESNSHSIQSKIPYVDYLLLQKSNEDLLNKPKTRYFAASFILHSALVALFAVIAIQELIDQKELKKNQEIQIEFEPVENPIINSQAAGINTPEPVTETSQLISASKTSNSNSTSSSTSTLIKPTPVPTPQPPKMVNATTAKETTPSVTNQITRSNKSNIKVNSTAAKETPNTIKEIPDTIDDIQAPELNHELANEVENSSAALNPFSVKEVSQALDSESENLSPDEDQKLASLSNDLQSETDTQLSELNNKSTQVASENNISDAVATRLDQLKAQKSKLKSGMNGAAKNSNQIGSPKGSNEGTDEGTETGTQVGIDKNSIRKLEDLRQKPGNPIPQYSIEERMNGLSGNIVFNAYVTKEGNLTLFNLVNSTGHRSLDRKTLLALKDWKFYPGQEGWVELTFKWDLKGGVQQKPTLLRRK